MIETALYKVLANFFEPADRKELGKVEGLCQLKSLEAGDVLFDEGEAAAALYFIIEGKIAVQRETAMAGKRQAVALLGAGSVVGEGALAGNTLHGARLVCVEKCVLAELHKSEFAVLEREAPELTCHILKGLLRLSNLRLRKSSERLARIL